MYICFKYKSSVDTVELLAIHFKYVHFLKEASNYNCCQYQCPQTFTNIKAFKKHLMSHTFSKTVGISNEIQAENVNNYLNDTCSISYFKTHSESQKDSRSIPTSSFESANLVNSE